MAASFESIENFHNLPVLVYKDGSGEIVYRGLAYSIFSKPSRLEELDMIRYEQAGFGIGIVTKLDDSFSTPQRFATIPQSRESSSPSRTWSRKSSR